MKIAVLGWGSLTWDKENLNGNLEVCGEWKSDGPNLPIELARISEDGRLTLVILPGSEDITVLWNERNHNELDAAIENLKEREGGRVDTV